MTTDTRSTSDVHPGTDDTRYLGLKSRVAALGCRLIEDDWCPEDASEGRTTPGLYIYDPKADKLLIVLTGDGWEGDLHEIEGWCKSCEAEQPEAGAAAAERASEKSSSDNQGFPSAERIVVYKAQSEKGKLIDSAERNLWDALNLLKLMRGADEEGYDVTPPQLSTVLKFAVPKIEKALRKLDQYGVDDMQRELERAGLKGGAS